jgi:hypothetical protein
VSFRQGWSLRTRARLSFITINGFIRCHAALNSRIDGPSCSALSAFLLLSYGTQITDICTQIADDVHDEVRPRFECKSGTMGDGWRGNLGRSATQGSYDSSLSRTPQTQLREHPRSGESTPLSSTLSAISVQTCPLNSAIWVQNLGITTHFPRFERSVTPSGGNEQAELEIETIEAKGGKGGMLGPSRPRGWRLGRYMHVNICSLFNYARACTVTVRA